MRTAFLLIAYSALGWSVPTGSPIPEQTAYVGNAAIELAPSPTAFAVDLRRRGLGDDIKSEAGSLVTEVESKISGFVNSGVLNFPNGFPTGTNVEKSLGISSTDVDPEPTQVLNLPSYGNWTESGWNLRIHGNVYKVPNVSQSKIDDLADVFLIGTSVKDLNATEAAQARNVTRSIFVLQQGNLSVTMNLTNNVAIQPKAYVGAVNAKGGAQVIKMPYNTTIEGDFDAFVHLKNTTGANGGHLAAGNATSQIQTLNMYPEGTNSGNATAYLVPPTGVTVVSDIDDILRVTKIYQPKEGLLNTFARPFTPWMNMPDIYANWSASEPNIHFHYLTTTPEQATRNYMDFIYKTYPLGSFDTRPLNFSNLDATLAIRKFLLEKVIQTFPKRKFVLVADTSNRDIMKDYPQMALDYPDSVACIFLRNTSATDSGDKLPYDTSVFKNVPKSKYMFFKVPDDLANLDIANGHCVNSTIPQNVTFSTQGLPFGLSKDSSGGQVGVPSAVMLLLSMAAVIATSCL